MAVWAPLRADNVGKMPLSWSKKACTTELPGLGPVKAQDPNPNGYKKKAAETKADMAKQGRYPKKRMCFVFGGFFFGWLALWAPLEPSMCMATCL